MKKQPNGAFWIKLCGLAGIVLAVILALKFTGLNLSDFTQEKIRRFILGYGIWAPLIFVVLYTLRGVALVVPAGIMSFVGGIAFGKWLGFVYIMIGAVAGACLAFLVCRIFGRTLVERFPLLQRGKIGRLDASTEIHGLKMILFLRLVPVFPYDAINVTAGLSRMKFRDYALGSFIGLIPASFIEAVMGSSVGNFRSPQFILAVTAWSLMILIPVVYRNIKKRKAL
jgi:uncharacterized membrane protein YdjX (TVP38/TMEM64 family)